MNKIEFRQAVFKDGAFHHWFYWGFAGYRQAFVGPITITGINSGYEVKESQAYALRGGPVSLKVYAGDIVTLDSRDIGGELVTGEVVWNDDPTLSRREWGLRLCGEQQGYYPTDFLGHLEVIGNIHENPELLEAK